jgi:hypothetical protein
MRVEDSTKLMLRNEGPRSARSNAASACVRYQTWARERGHEWLRAHATLRLAAPKALNAKIYASVAAGAGAPSGRRHSAPPPPAQQ